MLMTTDTFGRKPSHQVKVGKSFLTDLLSRAMSHVQALTKIVFGLTQRQQRIAGLGNNIDHCWNDIRLVSEAYGAVDFLEWIGGPPTSRSNSLSNTVVFLNDRDEWVLVPDDS